MSPRRHRAIRALGLNLALTTACSPPAFEPPDLAGWGGEAQVAARLRQAREATIAEPRSAAAVGRLGMVFHAHELHAEAVSCYRRATELDPEDPRWPYLAALAVAKTDLQGAVSDFERAVALKPQDPAIRVSFGDALVQLGRPEEAVDQYERAREHAPETTHALLGLARLALARGEPEEAVELLERAVRIAPWHGEVHNLLGQAYRRGGRSDDAELALRQAGAHPQTTRTPDAILAEMEAEAVSSRAFGRRGQRLAEEGRFVEAEAAFRRVLEIRPGNVRDISNLGGALAGQGRLDEAVEQYQKSLDLDPDDTYALNNLGMALAGQGELEAAAERLQRAIETDPSYADAHRNLGLVYSRQGRHEDAIARYREALTFDPSLAAAHNDLGTSLASRGALDEAMTHWRRAVEIDRGELSALYNLSVALVRRGEHREAVEWLRRGVETAPNSSRLALLLAWELATAPDPGLRDPVEAERLARRVYDAYPDQAQAGDVLAAALAAQGRFDEAVPVVEGALEQARGGPQPGLALQIATRLEQYRERQAFSQSGPR